MQTNLTKKHAGGRPPGFAVSPHIRFWKFVKKTNNCWEWLGTTTRGYGSMGSNTYAHRISWEIHNGPIPKGFCVLHKCDNSPCANPEHLFLGTQAENNFDASRKGRNNPFGKAGKLNPEKVNEIRSIFVRGSPTYGAHALGRKFGVNKRLIQNIIHRKIWKHVTP
jgi:hypothetical protein